MLLAVIPASALALDAPAAICGPQSALAEADRVANTVSWTTASEQDNFGYNVFRGPSEEGPFEKINEAPILGHGTTSLTHSYSYRDSDIDPCKAYWYYVESVSMQGVRERFTPIARVAPKVDPDKPAGAAHDKSAVSPSS